MKSTGSQSSKRAVKNTRRMFPGIYGANQKRRKVFQVSKNGSFSRYVPQERHIILPRPMSSIPFVFLVDLYSVTADILVAMPVEGTRRVFKFVRPHNRLRFLRRNLPVATRRTNNGAGSIRLVRAPINRASESFSSCLIGQAAAEGGSCERKEADDLWVGAAHCLDVSTPLASFKVPIAPKRREETDKPRSVFGLVSSLSLFCPQQQRTDAAFLCVGRLVVCTGSSGQLAVDSPSYKDR